MKTINSMFRKPKIESKKEKKAIKFEKLPKIQAKRERR